MGFKIDVNELTIGDIEELETLVGKPFGEIFADGNLSAKAMAAIVYVVKRRDEPGFTLDDARTMKLGEIEFDVEPDPTKPGGSSS